MLPDFVQACLFDLDGVLTRTAKLHAEAWKDMFDAFLVERAPASESAARPFELPSDYTAYVDGKLREDGVRSFLASRDIFLPEGAAADPPTATTIYGLGKRKNDMFLALLRRQGVEVFPDTIHFVEAVAARGLKRAVVTASQNGREVLASAGIDHFFDVVVDGLVAARENLRGKPAPDTFLAAASRLGVDPPHAAVFEDALAGVAAGRAGGFGWVVGVDRAGHADALRGHGADVVIRDFAELLTDE